GWLNDFRSSERGKILIHECGHDYYGEKSGHLQEDHIPCMNPTQVIAKIEVTQVCDDDHLATDERVHDEPLEDEDTDVAPPMELQINDQQLQRDPVVQTLSLRCPVDDVCFKIVSNYDEMIQHLEAEHQLGPF